MGSAMTCVLEIAVLAVAEWHGKRMIAFRHRERRMSLTVQMRDVVNNDANGPTTSVETMCKLRWLAHELRGV